MKVTSTHNERLLMLLEKFYCEEEYLDYVDRKINTKEHLTDSDRLDIERNNVDEWLIQEIILPAIKGAIINQELTNF